MSRPWAVQVGSRLRSGCTAGVRLGLMALGVWVASVAAAEPDAKLKALEAARQAGVITLEEYHQKKLQIQGTENDAKLRALEAALQAGILTPEEYRAKKAALGAPAAQEPDAPPAQSPAAPATGHPGKTYKHPTGVTFWYPADWRLKELEGIVQLLPPGRGETVETYETYFVTGERVAEEGITRADDPRVIQYLDEQIAALGFQIGVPFQRSGQPRAVTASGGEGKGTRLDWAGTTGIGEVKATALATILGEYGLVLAGVGVKDFLAQREPEISRIFLSFGVGKGKRDPLLAGEWHLQSSYAVQNDSVWETAYSRAKLVAETSTTLVLRADGTWTRQHQSHTIAGGGGVWLESKDATSSQGRWNADEGRLFMLWQDQSFQDYRYRLEGDALHLLTGDRGETWRRAK